MKEEQFIEKLKELQIEIINDQLEKLNIYYEFLVEYNKKVNLTAIVERDEVYLKHFYDSLTPTKIIDFSKINTMIDVGTGAGFPGVVLKIFFPSLKLTLLDSNNKKTIFLEQLLNKLKLIDVEVICSRSEILVKNSKKSYDLVVARAVKNLDVLLELCLPLVNNGGRFLAMKGKLDGELTDNISVIKYFDCEIEKHVSFNLPDQSNRNLLLIKKQIDAKTIKPREYSQIIKKPLKYLVK